MSRYFWVGGFSLGLFVQRLGFYLHSAISPGKLRDQSGLSEVDKE